MKNPNHPAKGSKITVEPIRNLDHITAIKQLLSSKLRDLLLFTRGINNGIRTGDILRLKVQDLANKRVADTISIKESKTGKTTNISCSPKPSTKPSQPTLPEKKYSTPITSSNPALETTIRLPSRQSTVWSRLERGASISEGTMEHTPSEKPLATSKEHTME